jgi:hypothetical protein
VQTPLSDIVEAVKAHQADIVALSFSGVTSPRAAVDNINELHARLGDGVEVWAGGAGWRWRAATCGRVPCSICTRWRRRWNAGAAARMAPPWPRVAAILSSDYTY